MKSIAILLLLSPLVLTLTWAKSAPDLRIEQLSDEQAAVAIREHVGAYSEEEKNLLAQAVYRSGRVDLILESAKIRGFPMAKAFLEAPQSDLKSWLAINILKNDSQWYEPPISGSSGVGGLYHQSLIMCDSVITPYFKDGGIDWTGVLTRERRLGIADKFERLLSQEHGFRPPAISHPKNTNRKDPGSDENSRPSQENWDLRQDGTGSGADSGQAGYRNQGLWLALMICCMLLLTLFLIARKLWKRHS